MALNFPNNRREIVEKLQTDVKTELPQSNPYLRNNFLLALLTGIAGRFFDIYRQLASLIDIFFDDTTYGIYLEKKASPYGIVRLPAKKSSGNILATGSAGSVIPIDTLYRTQDGLQFITLASATISSNNYTLASLTSTGGVATATTSTAHNLASNTPISLTGAVQTEYNVTDALIQVISATQFTFEITGTPASPATGTIIANSVGATLEIESINFGSDNNLVGGTQLTLLSAIAGVDNNAFVQFTQIGGGADIETDDELRERYIYRKQNPVANFNIVAITNEARKVAYVDRVWVYEITPDIGQATIYFIKKDGTLPSAGELTEVKNQILTIKPVNTSDSDIFLVAPTLLSVNFTFSALSPNTTAIQQAITDNLTNFFATEIELGIDIPESAYIATIQNSRDITSGQKVDSFTLSSPTGNVSVASNELPVLGTINF